MGKQRTRRRGTLNAKLLRKSAHTLFFIRLLLILIQFTGWGRKSNLQGWVGTRYERLEVIGAVLGRTHILLWRRKFFIRGRRKRFAIHETLRVWAAYVSVMNTRMNMKTLAVRPYWSSRNNLLGQTCTFSAVWIFHDTVDLGIRMIRPKRDGEKRMLIVLIYLSWSILIEVMDIFFL